MASAASLTPLLAPLRQQLLHNPIRTILPAVFPRPHFLPIVQITLLSNPIFTTFAGLFSSLWDGVLNAVPKKKSSYSRKRKRQLHTTKRLKDVTALGTCSGCGRLKRMHVLCPYCVRSIKDMWKGKTKEVDHTESSGTLS